MSSLRSAFLVAVLLTGCASPAVPDDDDSSPDPEQTVHVVTIDAADSVVERSDGTGFDLADGWAFQDWSRSFYAEHGDDYDFLLVFTDFLIPGFWQFAWTAKIDVGGIGIAEQNLQWYGEGLGADYTADAGSAGRLQALVVMNSLELWQQSWLTAQDILTHEVGHRWGMATRLPWEADETLLLDGHGHWTLVLEIGRAHV